MIKLASLSRKTREESGSSMVFALIVMILALTATMLIAGYTLTSLATTRTLNSLSSYDAAADAAINNALLIANSGNGSAILAAHQEAGNAVNGSLTPAQSSSPVKWSWYTKAVAVSGQQVDYYVYAVGYSKTPTDSDAKTVRALIAPKAVTGGSYDSGVIVYQAQGQAVHQWGLMGLDGITTFSGLKVNSFNSYQNLNPTASDTASAFASNGNITLAGSTGVNQFAQFGPGTLSSRCNGNGCSSVEVSKQKYNFSLAGITSQVQAACPLDSSSYPSWVASANSGVLNTSPSNECFNNVIFDTNTSLPASASAGNPMFIFAKGDITVNAGVTVNAGRSPVALQIFSQSGSGAVFQNGTATSPTVFSGLVGGATIVCVDTSPHDGNTSQTLIIYGSFACSALNFGSSTVLWQDEAANNIANSNQPRLWSVVKYENIS